MMLFKNLISLALRVLIPVAISASTSQRSYKILSSSEITHQLKDLAERYPKLCTLTTSQDEYNLPTAGRSADCTFDSNVTGCLNYILTIQDSILQTQRRTQPYRKYSSVVNCMEMNESVPLPSSKQHLSFSKRLNVNHTPDRPPWTLIPKPVRIGY